MRRPTAQDTENALTRRHGLWSGLLASLPGDVNLGDRLFRVVTAAFAMVIVLMLGAMAVQMMRASAASLSRFGLGFITSKEWDPVHETFGALPFIYGTVVSSLLALVIAVPISLGIAIYLAELSPGWVRRPLGFIVELLAAIPSVVYGLWGIFVLAPWLPSALIIRRQNR